MNGLRSIKGVVVAIVLVGVITAIGIVFFKTTGNKVREFLYNDSKFKYDTSVTSNYNSKNKADIFKTDMKPKDATKYIEKNCKGYDYSKTIETNDSYAIGYANEDVLVYKGDDGKTYVQVADDEYVRNNGYTSTYRRSSWNPATTILLLDLLERRKHNSSGGWFGSSSVRTSSSGSRTSVGGGTSFGK